MAFVLAAAVPIFSDLIGITAALFAAWYTYGLAGFFWLHDTYHLKGGATALKSRPFGVAFAALTIAAGAFICVAGAYVSVKVSGCSMCAFRCSLRSPRASQLIVDAYKEHLVGKPFTCQNGRTRKCIPTHKLVVTLYVRHAACYAEELRHRAGSYTRLKP